MSLLSPINALFNHSGLRRFVVHTRQPLALAGALIALWFVEPSPWFWYGLAVSLVGAVGQWWCFACIMTSQELAVNGPYRFVCNPMYLTRYLLVLGLVLTLDPTRPWRWLLPVGYTVLYLFFMHNRVRREERKLTPIFGEAYQRYLRAVPRFVPSLRPYPGGRTLFWNPVAFKRNHGARNAAIVLCGYALAYALVHHVFPCCR
ncbi:MAG: methyltransferase [Kiritimatiellae bacterium]|nr:methyltransferase [Kiritimatiellia bacterium]